MAISPTQSKGKATTRPTTKPATSPNKPKSAVTDNRPEDPSISKDTVDISSEDKSHDGNGYRLADSLKSAFAEPDEEATVDTRTPPSHAPSSVMSVEGYREAHDLVDSIDKERFPTNFTPERREAEGAARLVLSRVHNFYDSALNGVGEARDSVDLTTGRVNSLLKEQAPLLEGEELERLKGFADSKLGSEQAKLEGSTQKYVDVISDPVFEEHLKNMSASEQANFFSDLADNLPSSEKGREWLSGLADAISDLGNGKDSDHTVANLAVQLREKLEGKTLDQFDSDMGLIVGMDLALRPDENGERLSSVASALGIPAEEIEGLKSGSAHPDQLGKFGSSVATTSSIIDAGKGIAKSNSTLANLRTVAGRIPGNKEILGLTGKGLSLLGKAVKNGDKLLGGAGTLFSLVSVASSLREGQLDEAAMGGVGILGSFIAGSATGPVAFAGATLLGLSMAYPHLKETVQAGNFKKEAIEYATGQHPDLSLRASMIASASEDKIELLNKLKPDGMSLPKFLDQYLDDYQDLSALTSDVWRRLQYEFSLQDSVGLAPWS